MNSTGLFSSLYTSFRCVTSSLINFPRSFFIYSEKPKDVVELFERKKEVAELFVHKQNNSLFVQNLPACTKKVPVMSRSLLSQFEICKLKRLLSMKHFNILLLKICLCHALCKYFIELCYYYYSYKADAKKTETDWSVLYLMNLEVDCYAVIQSVLHYVPSTISLVFQGLNVNPKMSVHEISDRCGSELLCNAVKKQLKVQIMQENTFAALRMVNDYLFYITYTFCSVRAFFAFSKFLALENVTKQTTKSMVVFGKEQWLFNYIDLMKTKSDHEELCVVVSSLFRQDHPAVLGIIHILFSDHPTHSISKGNLSLITNGCQSVLKGLENLQDITWRMVLARKELDYIPILANGIVPITFHLIENYHKDRCSYPVVVGDLAEIIFIGISHLAYYGRLHRQTWNIERDIVDDYSIVCYSCEKVIPLFSNVTDFSEEYQAFLVANLFLKSLFFNKNYETNIDIVALAKRFYTNSHLLDRLDPSKNKD